MPTTTLPIRRLAPTTPHARPAAASPPPARPPHHPSTRSTSGAAATTSLAAPVAGPGFAIDPPGVPSDSTVTVQTSTLAPHQVLDALVTAVHPDDAERYKALYSSDLGGIITEPALMVLAADDHGVHRGHAVFDTLAIIEGRVYLLDAHLARFFNSAAAAGLTLPFSRSQVRRVVLETAAAGAAMDGSVRVWLGAGRGGYGLSARECRRPSLHVAVYTPAAGTDARLLTPEGDPDGLALYTARSVPPPDAWAAGIKSTNYLRNALAQAEAEARGFDLGVFADPETGIVTEAANASVGIITAEKELVIPPWDRALPGVTAQRVADLLPSWLDSSVDLRAAVSSFSRRSFTKAEAHHAAHAFVMGTSLKLAPVVRWDEAVIGDGSPGLAVLILQELMQADMDPLNDTAGDVFTQVPFLGL